MLRDNLKSLRKARGITTKDMARRLNIPYQTYLKYESTDNWPPQQRLIDIADLLGVSIDTLLGRSEVWPYKAISTKRCPDNHDYELVDVGDGGQYHVKKELLSDRLDQIKKVAGLNESLRVQLADLLESSERRYRDNIERLELMRNILATSEQVKNGD